MVLSIAVLKNEINNFIIANGANAISGNIMNSVLGDLIDSVVAASVATTTGSSAPNNANGNEGDLYFQTGVGIYRKTSGSWFLGFSVTGNIVNQNNSPQTANYWITGSGKAANMSVTNVPSNPTDVVRLSDLSVLMPLTGGVFMGDVQQNNAPINSTSLINKGYADNLLAGLQFIGQACVAASVANVNITTAPASLDGIVGVGGTSRWLLKNQAAPAENGVYLFNGTGNPLTRTADASTGVQIANKTIPVTQGSAQADTWWTITNDTITIGTTAITIVQTAGSGTYSNGTGISLAGNIFSLNTTYTNALYAPIFTGTGYSKYTSGTLAYVTTIPNTDLTNSAITIQGTSVSLGGSINVVNGTGFVKASGFAISYDNNVYITGASITWPGTTYNSPTNGSVSGNTITFSPALNTQNANVFFSGPATGIASVPTWRNIVAGDIPTLNQNTTGSSGSVTNAITFNSGGAGATSGSTFNGSAAITVSYNTLGAQQAVTVTNVGTSGNATLINGVLNIPQYTGGGGGTSYTAGAGLTLTGTVFSVNTTQNIASLSNLTSNGPVITSGTTGTLSIAATTGTGNIVYSTSPTLVTPVLGIASATTINKVTFTTPATGSTLTIIDGKTLTSNNTLTLAGTDGSTLNIGTGGTLGTNAYNSTNFVPQTTTVAGFGLSSNISLASLTAANATLTFSISYNGSAAATIGINLANTNTWTALQTFGTNISIGGVTATGATGTGNNVYSSSPTLVTPVLGVATATSINGNIWTTGTGTLTLGTGKTFTSSNTLTLAGTDGTTMTFPSTSATIARTDAANTFTGHQTIEGITSTGATGTGNFVYSISPTFTGTPTMPTGTIAVTQATSDSSTAIATTAFVQNLLTSTTIYFGSVFNGAGTSGSPIGIVTDSVPTSLSSNFLTSGSIYTALSAKSNLLIPTAIKTGAYILLNNDYVPTNSTSGTVPLTLPTAPPNGTLVGAKMVIQSGSNTTTLTTGGTDVYNKTGGSTVLTLSLLNQGVILEYYSGIWYVLDEDLPLSQLDLRYAPIFTGTGYSKYTSGALAYVTTIPLATDVSGTLQAAQFPALTGDITTTAGSLVSSASGALVKTVVLNTAGVIFTTPINFSTVSGTATGTMSLATQTANTLFAGPTTGTAATPTFRAIVINDLFGGTSASSTTFLRGDGTWATPSGGGGTTTNALTINNAGTGDVSGSTFNGSAAITVSYNTVGAAPTIGSSSVTTLGTIGTGTWHGTIIGAAYGGTGVNNGSNNITLAGNLTTSGAFDLTLTQTALTNVTLPTTGTLATLSGTETFSNKTLTTPNLGTTSTVGYLWTATDTTGAGSWQAPSGTTTNGLTAGTTLTATVGASPFNGSAAATYDINLAHANTWTALQTYQAGVVTSGNITSTAWGTAGPNLQTVAATYTDSSTAAGATVTNNFINTFGAPTVTAANATSGSKVTYSTSATVYIAASPAAGLNTLLTNSYALYVAGSANFSSGTVTVVNLTVGSALLVGSTGTTLTFSSTSSTSAFGGTNVAAYQANGSTNIQYRTGFYGNTSSTLSASNSYGGVIFAQAPITTNTSGTSAILSNVIVTAPTFTLGTGSTTTYASSFYIDGAPTTAGSGTLTNPVLALMVKAGNCYMGGTLNVISGLIGVTTNSNAASGTIGEYVSSTIATASSVTLTTATAANVTSISLTAGDWDVTGVVDFNPGAGTTTTSLQGGISTTSATLGAQDSYFSNTFAIATTSIDASEVCPTVRLSLSSTTTVYLVTVAGFAVSTLKAYGTIRARRVR